MAREHDGAAGPAGGGAPGRGGAGTHGDQRVQLHIHQVRADLPQARGGVRPDGAPAEADGHEEGGGGGAGAHTGDQELAGAAQQSYRQRQLRRHPGGPEADPGRAGAAHPQVLCGGSQDRAGGPRQVLGSAGGEVQRGHGVGGGAARAAQPGGGGGHPRAAGERAGAAGARARAPHARAQEDAGAGGEDGAHGRLRVARGGGDACAGAGARVPDAAPHPRHHRGGAGVHRDEAAGARRRRGPRAARAAQPGAAQDGAGGEHRGVRQGAGDAEEEGEGDRGAGHARAHPGPHQRVVRGEPRPSHGRVPRLPRRRGWRVERDPESAAAPAGGGRGRGCARCQGWQGGEGRPRQGRGGRRGGAQVSGLLRQADPRRGERLPGRLAGHRRELQLLSEVRPRPRQEGAEARGV
mmetsp:Transcript_27563/g.67783  ORF Transcript_27563/g.67783 Transcript_27563/m.67783 type:complete len:408 (-) Transcript_27563:2645-3868(-)